MFLLLAVATFLICSVLLTVPKAKGCSGCLFDLLRFVALVGGALAAFIILFGSGQDLSALFQGVVEATEEAIYNSLFKATTVTSRGRTIEALPMDRLREILAKYRVTNR